MDKFEIYHSPAQNTDPWNRTLCSVLEEMRTCYNTRNFALLPSLIEEVQTYANRMEAKLHDVKDYNKLKDRYSSLKQNLDALENKHKRP